MKIAIFGTHPHQYNGYSKVVYEIICQLAAMEKEEDVRAYVFGFQNLYPNDKIRAEVPSNIMVYDAMADESPKASGFGFRLVKDFIALVQPDVAVVFNDMSVLTAIVNELKDAPERSRFKVVAYVDQVYLNQKRQYIEFVNRHADAAIAFTPGWEKCIREQGLTLPTFHLPHGINTDVYYPIPRYLARRYYGFREDEFLILNFNRNQPRKRWDTCLKAMAELVKRLPSAPVKLIVGTSTKGAWDLLEIFDRELNKRGVPLEEGRKRIMVVDTPQRMEDREVNMLLNVCDVGINTCDGEGFGLCNFEHAAVGKPQVVPRLGAFPDMFDEGCAMLIEPKVAFYLDSTRDAVGGEALMCDHADFADALEEYYRDPMLREIHGKRARQRILANYRWPQIAKKLCGICRATLRGDFVLDPPHAQTTPEGTIPNDGFLSATEDDGSSNSTTVTVDEVVSLMEGEGTGGKTAAQEVPPSTSSSPATSAISATSTAETSSTCNDDFSFDVRNVKPYTDHGVVPKDKKEINVPNPATDERLASMMKQLADMQAALQSLCTSSR